MANESLSACLAEIKTNPALFYVYVLARPDGQPFYVGCGRGRRIACHEREARTSKRYYKLSIIRKIWCMGGAVSYRVDSWHPDWETVAAREVELIATLGRVDLGTGPLANRTAGGDGACELSQEAIAKKSEQTRLRWESPEYRARMSLMSRVTWGAPGYREAVSDAVRRAKLTPQAVERQSAMMHMLWSDPAYRERQAEAKALRTQEFGDQDRELRSVVMRAKYEDPDYRSRHAAATRAAVGSDEQRSRQSAGSRKAWADLEHRSKMTVVFREAGRRPALVALRSAVAKELWSDPVYRDKVLTSRKENGRANPLPGGLAAAAWHRDNPELARAQMARAREGARKWREANPVRVSEMAREKVAKFKEWAKNNPEAVRASALKAAAASSLSHARKGDARRRCMEMLELIRDDIAPPNAKAGWRVWEEFERELAAVMARQG
jgi:hypothetical protein